MPLCVFTRYIGPTNTRAARIVAYSSAPDSVRVFVGYHSCEGSTTDKHDSAARAFADKHLTRALQGGHFDLVRVGDSADGKGFTYALMPRDYLTTRAVSAGILPCAN